jgi:hypothetical protein
MPMTGHMLQDLQRHGGRYSGFVDLGFHAQSMENEGMRAAFELPVGRTGILINLVEPLSPARAALCKDGAAAIIRCVFPIY